MAHVLEDRVLETATTTGTGSFTLAGAVDRFRAFSAVCSTSDTFPYYIEGEAGTGEWETGVGTYSGANTLARTAVRESSNAGAAVNFSAGTKRVGLSPNVASGTAFPGTPVSGEVFRRTDRNIEYFYNGTHWLSTNLYETIGGAYNNLPGSTATTAHIFRWPKPFGQQFEVFIEDFFATVSMSTTGDWTVTLNKFEGSTSSVVALGNTGSITYPGNTGYNSQTTVAIDQLVETTYDMITVSVTENSGAATFAGQYGFLYRLVG